MIFIYGLIDPRDSTLFYVGLTRRGSKEPEGYIKSAHRGSTMQPVRRFLRHLHKLGITTLWQILEECDDSNVEDVERFWIASVRATGAKLFNVKDGGQAGGYGQRHSAETRALISAKSRLKTMSPEARKKISEANKGKKRSAESCLKMRKPKSPGHGAKVSAARKGVKLSNETRERMVAEGKHLGRPRNRIVRSCSTCGSSVELTAHSTRNKHKRIFCNKACFNARN